MSQGFHLLSRETYHTKSYFAVIVGLLSYLYMYRLKREASSVLRTSGWSNEVEAFMRSKKRSCAGKLGNTSEESFK